MKVRRCFTLLLNFQYDISWEVGDCSLAALQNSGHTDGWSEHAVLGRFLHSLNKFCEEEYGLLFDIPDYSVYEFAKVAFLVLRLSLHSVVFPLLRYCLVGMRVAGKANENHDTCRSGIAPQMSPIT